MVVKKVIRRPIPRIEIRNGIAILVQSLIVAVQAKVNVQPPVVVIVGNGRMSECPLRRMCEPKRVPLQRKLSLTGTKNMSPPAPGLQEMELPANQHPRRQNAL